MKRKYMENNQPEFVRLFELMQDFKCLLGFDLKISNTMQILNKNLSESAIYTVNNLSEKYNLFFN